MDRRLEDISNISEMFTSIFGNKWRLVIMYDLIQSPKRFNELKRDLDPISQTVLSKQLKELLSLNSIERIIEAEPVISVTYQLSDVGRSIVSFYLPIYQWLNENYKCSRDPELAEHLNSSFAEFSKKPAGSENVSADSVDDEYFEFI